MSADRFCAPDETKSKYFQKTKSGYNYLCAGGFMGKAKVILDTIDMLFENVDKDISQENKDFHWTDQYLWTKLFIHKKANIVLDVNCEIFQTLSSIDSIPNLYEFVNNEPELSEDEDLYQRKSLTNTISNILSEIEITDSLRIFNKTTKSYPVQIHFNSRINKIVMLMEPFIQLIEKVNN